MQTFQNPSYVQNFGSPIVLCQRLCSRIHLVTFTLDLQGQRASVSSGYVSRPQKAHQQLSFFVKLKPLPVIWFCRMRCRRAWHTDWWRHPNLAHGAMLMSSKTYSSRSRFLHLFGTLLNFNCVIQTAWKFTFNVFLSFYWNTSNMQF